MENYIEKQNNTKIETDKTVEVLHDTQKAIDNLSKAIVDQKLDAQKKESINSIVNKLSQKLLFFNWVDNLQKKDLNRIITLLDEKKDISNSDLDCLTKIIGSLENKKEFSVLDKKLALELNDTLLSSQKDLNGLKESVINTVDEWKEKLIDAMTKELDSKRYTSRLANPIHDYLVDKYINKKSISKFKDRVMWVGVSIATLFLSDEIKNLINNIDNLSLEQLQQSILWETKVVENVKEFTDTQIEEAKNKFRNYLRVQIKKNTGKDLSDEQLDRIMKKLNLTDELKNTASEWRGIAEYLIKNDWSDTDLNLLDSTMSTMFIPLKVSARILKVLKEEWVLSYQQFGLHIVGDMVEYWFKWFQLFWEWLWRVMWKVSMDEISDKMWTLYEESPEEAKYILFALMYRSTNSIFFKWISNVGAYITKMALWPLVESTDDIRSLSVTMDGYKANLDETIKNLEKMTKSLPAGERWILADYITEIKRTTETLNTQNKINKILSWLDDWPDLLEKLKSNYKSSYWSDLPSDFEKQLENIAKWKWKGFLTKSQILKWPLSQNIRLAWKSMIDSIQNKSFFSKAKLVFGSSPIQDLQKMWIMEDVAKNLDDVCLTYWKVVSNQGSWYKKWVFSWMKSRLNLINSGLNMSESVDRAIFKFGSIDDMGKFLDYTKTIARSSPEAIKFLIWKSPIFLVAWMSMASEWDFKEKMWKLGENLKWLVPFVWPYLLISDSMNLDDFDRAQAGVWSALLISDVVYWVRDWKKIWYGKSFVKALAKPIIDVWEIISAWYKSWTTIRKRGKWWVTLLKVEWLVWFSKSLFAEINAFRTVTKLWVYAALIYGWYCGIEYIMDNIDDKEVRNMVAKYKNNKEWFNIYLQEQRPKYDDETKSNILKYSIWAKLGVSPEIVKEIKIKCEKWVYNIQLPIVYSRDILLTIRNNLSDTLKVVEPSSQISMSISWLAQVRHKDELKSQWYSDDEIKKQYESLWYKI